ncbi:unnamed protein product [Phytophthora fragariaefolia]|uniref:Unnamed protein product n=1 Tax=Phytophthora fragariaefolia TaxID=1490495 RepID=A0A9W6YC98_9STRA|nr:unnamed protein product [Phytophthora fragariaefolia]
MCKLNLPVLHAASGGLLAMPRREYGSEDDIDGDGGTGGTTRLGQRKCGQSHRNWASVCNQCRSVKATSLPRVYGVGKSVLHRRL